ncbi:MAG: peptide deformylase [Capsulimonadaceae bacterium]
MAKAVAKLTDLIRKDDPIVKYEGDGRNILRQVSKPVLRVTEEHAELVAMMQVIMQESNGVGLAAPQLGILQRIFVFDAGEGFHAVINPKILQRKGSQVGVEGCLSIPGLYGDVERANEVVIKGVDETGHPVRIRGEGLTARVILHENDHLDGILFIDHADPDTLHTAKPGEAADPGTRE